MEEYFLKLTPANRKGNIDFSVIAMETFEEIPIFSYAENYVNQTDNFQKRKKILQILEIESGYLIVKLSSASKLEMASKSLAGFSRELLRIDERRALEGKPRLFEAAIYNHGLFKSEIVRGKEEIAETASNLSDSAALKLFIDLLYREPTKTREDSKKREEAIFSIKEILANHF